MRWKFEIVLILLIGIFVFQGESKGVHVSLNANWEETPFFLEIAEFLANVDSNLYIKFLDEYYKQVTILDDNEEEIFKTFNNDREFVEYVTKIAKKILYAEENKKLLDLSLSTRLFSPSIIFNW